MDYEVDAVGNSGVAKVELWGTRDGGRHWQRFGQDDDNRSPIVATVVAEGLYGFRVVVESGNGLASETPRDGDLPEVWINVDLTKPTARITATDVAHEQGEVTIRWEAGDAALEPRPISLWFSDQPQGPWTPIASGLENTGSFVWRLDNHVPRAGFSAAGSPRRSGQRRDGRNPYAGSDRSSAAARADSRRASGDFGRIAREPTRPRTSAGSAQR